LIRLKLVILILSFVFVATAGAATSVRLVKLKVNDVAMIQSNRLSCIVSKISFLCAELGGFPRLTFYANTTGGDAGKGEFFIFRSEWSGAQMELLAQESRRD
jgi:hypothetical protein